MPRYYFDITDGAATMRDAEGSDLSNPHEALREARETAAEMALDTFPKRNSASLVIEVRDGTGAKLFRLHMIQNVETF
jgi:hypothetical protein